MFYSSSFLGWADLHRGVAGAEADCRGGECGGGRACRDEKQFPFSSTKIFEISLSK